MPNETKKSSNVVSMKKRPAKRERLTRLDDFVLSMVRQCRDPREALDCLEREPPEDAVEASLAKLERLGFIKKATGYVAVSGWPTAALERDASGHRVIRPEALSGEFCVPVDVVCRIVRRVGIEPGTTYVVHTERAKAG